MARDRFFASQAPDYQDEVQGESDPRWRFDEGKDEPQEYDEAQGGTKTNGCEGIPVAPPSHPFGTPTSEKVVEMEGV